MNAFGLFLERARPRSPTKDYREGRTPRDFPRPDEREYWARRVAAGELELGHLFKYPYGFFGLRRHSPNSELNQVCWDQSFRLFTS